MSESQIFHEPLPKRRCDWDFSIDYLLNHAGGNSVKGYDYYIKKLSTENDQNDKFKMKRTKVKYLMQNFEEFYFPSEMVKQCFQKSINEAFEIHNNTDEDRPNRIGINIASENIDSDINISFSQITEHILKYSIFHKFQHIQYSRKNDGASLFEKPFIMTINISNRSKLPCDQGTAGKGKRKLVEVKHNIDPQKLISIENTRDSYCLFYALVVMKEYIKDYLLDRKLNAKQFLNFKQNVPEQKSRVDELMKAAGIQLGLEEYDVEIYLPIVQDYWNREYPGLFKIFVFAEYGTYKPIFQTNIDTYVHPILIYHSNNHYAGIRCMHKFFNSSQYYCFSCCCPYNKPKNHSANCNARCINCQRVGVGFPCPNDQMFNEKCPKCLKNFSNYECYQFHIIKNICNESKKCVKCAAIYSLKELKRKGNKQHRCMRYKSLFFDA